MNQPVRRETDARRNGARRNGGESTKRDDFILWKTFCLSSDGRARTRQAVVVRAVVVRGFLRFAVKPHAGITALPSSSRECRQNEMTRPGGQPDGSSHMGAWGGWALAPNIAVGERFPLPRKLVAVGPPHVQKRDAIFLISREGFSGRKSYCAAGRAASLAAGFSAAIVVTGGLRARTAGVSFCSGAVSRGLGGSDCGNRRRRCAVTASTAA